MLYRFSCAYSSLTKREAKVFLFVTAAASCTSDLLRAGGEGGRLVAVAGACMERRNSLAGLCGRSSKPADACVPASSPCDSLLLPGSGMEGRVVAEKPRGKASQWGMKELLPASGACRLTCNLDSALMLLSFCILINSAL